MNTNREAYVAPTNIAIGADDALTAKASDLGPETQYLCGECNAKVRLRKGDAIRCKECGHRVLYKERTKRCVLTAYCQCGLSAKVGALFRMVQFEAR